MATFELTTNAGQRYQIDADTPEAAQKAFDSQFGGGGLLPAVPYDAADAAAHGFTFGLSDMAGSAGTALGRYLRGVTPNFDYAQAARETQRGREAYAGSSPWTSGLTNLVGALASPVTQFGGAAVNAVANPFAKIGVSGLTGGALGAGQGAADRSTSLAEAGQGALTGGEVGAAVGAAIPAAAALVPPLTAAAQTLRSAGVEPLPGAARGGVLGTLENLLSKVPVLGLPIQAGRRGAQEQLANVMDQNARDFFRGAVNNVLEPVGESLAPGTRLGNDAIAEMAAKVHGAYGAAVPAAGAPIDAAATTAMNDARNNLASLAPNMVNQFDTFLNKNLHSKVNPAASLQAAQAASTGLGGFSVSPRAAPAGVLPGDAFQTADQVLRTEASRLLGSGSNLDEQALGNAYRDVQRTLRDNLVRNAPGSADELLAANEAWKRLLPVQHAAGSDLATGMFAPEDLARSARNVAGRARYARGHVPMQDYAQNAIAGDQALSDAARSLRLPSDPSMLGTSVMAGGLAGGLANAAWQNPALAVKLAAPMGLLSAMYSNTGRRGLNWGLNQVGGLLDPATPYAPAAGGFASGLLHLNP